MVGAVAEEHGQALGHVHIVGVTVAVLILVQEG